MNKLTKKEMQMMEIFWEATTPLSTVDLFVEHKEQKWSKNYIQNTVAKLLKKGFIKECGLVRSNTQYARQFTAQVGREEYSMMLLRDLKVSPYNLPDMIIHLAKEDEQIDKEKMIIQLEETLNQLKEEEE